MPIFLSLISLGCFAGAAASFQLYDGKHLELLILCGVILEAAASIVAAILRSAPKETPVDFEAGEVLFELKEINRRLVNIQLAVESSA
jgi:hypothetical protein